MYSLREQHRFVAELTMAITIMTIAIAAEKVGLKEAYLSINVFVRRRLPRPRTSATQTAW